MSTNKIRRLSWNNIVKIPAGAFQRLKSLNVLHLQMNAIGEIEEGAFAGLTHLRELDLHSNVLTIIKAKTFRPLMSLVRLDLSHNIISNIEDDAFRNLNKIRSLVLNGNHFFCDCELLWLRKWLLWKRHTVEITGAACSMPETFKGQMISDTEGRLFICPERVCGHLGPSVGAEKLRHVHYRDIVTVYYRCVQGHELMSGDLERSCDFNKPYWTGQSPVCSAKNCGDPGRGIYAKRHGDSYTYLSEVHYECWEGYYLVAGDLRRRCSIDQNIGLKWEGSPPICLLDTSTEATPTEETAEGSSDTSSHEHGSEEEEESIMKEVEAILSRIEESLPVIETPTEEATGIITEPPIPLLSPEEEETLRILHHGRPAIDSHTEPDITEEEDQEEDALLSGGVLSVVERAIDVYDEHIKEHEKKEDEELIKAREEIYNNKEQEEEEEDEVHDEAEEAEVHGSNIITETGLELPDEILKVFEEHQHHESEEVAENGVFEGRNRISDEDVMRMLKELAAVDAASDNILALLGALEELAEKEVDLDADQLDLATAILERIVKLDGIDVMIAGRLVKVISYLTGLTLENMVEAETQYKACTRIVKSVDVMNMQVKSTDPDEMFESKHLATGLVNLGNSFKGMSFADYGDGQVQLYQEDGSSRDKHSSYIRLPPSLLNGRDLHNISRVHFAVYRESNIFKAMQKASPHTHHSPIIEAYVKDSRDIDQVLRGDVISASVDNLPLTELPDPVKIVFYHEEDSLIGDRECVYWDFQLNDHKGGWSSEGCNVYFAADTHTVCHCNHLTNFALLMDVYGSTAKLSAENQKALSIISMIGCAVSSAGLLFALITFLLFRTLRRDNPTKILINLCVALLLVNLTFVTLSHPEQFHAGFMCKTHAMVMHYALLAAIAWMGIEAVNMYLAFVKVFDTYYTNFVMKICLAGWGTPLVIVAITAAIDIDVYGFKEGICYLSGIAFYAAFVAPVCVVLLFNTTMYGLVLRHVVRMRGKAEKSELSEVITKLKRAAGLCVLLGVTWLFAMLAIDKAAVFFSYVFAICNSMQGFFIFVFHCVLRKSARKRWMALLPCWPDDQQDLSRYRSSGSRGSRGSSPGSYQRAVANRANRPGSATSVRRLSALSGVSHRPSICSAGSRPSICSANGEEIKRVPRKFVCVNKDNGNDVKEKEEEHDQTGGEE
ncbi:ADGRG4 [Branchiostoma lanceolatum]|uniref:ADGRG4 protein n=1 Tax=Branchiostoma lanceolatum TaxID=7740 RepID=A0A8J9Z5B7_BRALA|nr:ADGRG4 [Branchiostoma lanceolatum]